MEISGAANTISWQHEWQRYWTIARFKSHLKKKTTYQSTAQTAVMKLCTNDVEIFLHFHEFLQADSGMGSLPIPAFTSLKRATELPVVKITEPSSMAEMLVDGAQGEDSTGHGEWERREGGEANHKSAGQTDGRQIEVFGDPEITITCRLFH